VAHLEAPSSPRFDFTLTSSAVDAQHTGTIAFPVDTDAMSMASVVLPGEGVDGWPNEALTFD